MPARDGFDLQMPLETSHQMNGHIEAPVAANNVYQSHINGYDCSQDVVVSGLSGRLPESDSIEEFRQHLLNGDDMVTDDDRRWPPGECPLIKQGLVLVSIALTLRRLYIQGCMVSPSEVAN